MSFLYPRKDKCTHSNLSFIPLIFVFYSIVFPTYFLRIRLLRTFTSFNLLKQHLIDNQYTNRTDTPAIYLLPSPHLTLPVSHLTPIRSGLIPGDLPSHSLASSEIEKDHVFRVYDNIAVHWNHTRGKRKVHTVPCSLSGLVLVFVSGCWVVLFLLVEL